MQASDFISPCQLVVAQPVGGKPASPEAGLNDCWHTIGVHGNGSCPELATHVHCRNCSAFAQAAARLLDRPPPEGYRREWTTLIGGPQPRPAVTDTSVVLFRIGSEWFALDTPLVQEVTEHRPLHTLPHRRLGVVLGLVNVNGELVICVSLARLLRLGQDAPWDATRQSCHRLIVFNPGDGRFAFPADEVQGVHRFNQAALQAIPATVARDRHSLTRGLLAWRGRSVGCLDGGALGRSLNHALQ